MKKYIITFHLCLPFWRCLFLYWLLKKVNLLAWALIYCSRVFLRKKNTNFRHPCLQWTADVFVGSQGGRGWPGLSRVVTGWTRVVQCGKGGPGWAGEGKDGQVWAKYVLAKTTFSYWWKTNKIILNPIGNLKNKGFGLKIKLVHTLHQVPFQIASPLLTKGSCPENVLLNQYKQNW